MYSVIKNVLKHGGYKLDEMLRKIERFWLLDLITDDQRDELLSLARSGADGSVGADVFAKIAELEERVRKLENSKPTAEDEPTEPTEPEEFKVGKWYYNGDLVAFEGEIYECTAPEGVACVWSPKDYPAYWKKVR